MVALMDSRRAALPASLPASSVTEFGQLLGMLRLRARLTQRELAVAVGCSEAQIYRLEQEGRLPDPGVVAAIFLPALRLGAEPELAARLYELAVLLHRRQSGEAAPATAPTPPCPAPHSPAATCRVARTPECRRCPARGRATDSRRFPVPRPTPPDNPASPDSPAWPSSDNPASPDSPAWPSPDSRASPGPSRASPPSSPAPTRARVTLSGAVVVRSLAAVIPLSAADRPPPPIPAKPFPGNPDRRSIHKWAASRPIRSNRDRTGCLPAFPSPAR